MDEGACVLDPMAVELARCRRAHDAYAQPDAVAALRHSSSRRCSLLRLTMFLRRNPASGREAGAALLNDVRAFLSRFIAYPSEHAKVAHVLWITHAHLMDA